MSNQFYCNRCGGLFNCSPKARPTWCEDYFEHLANEALSRAEKTKPETETCVWTWCCFGNWHTSCGYDWGGEDKPNTCPACGKRIEVAGKAEGIEK